MKSREEIGDKMGVLRKRIMSLRNDDKSGKMDKFQEMMILDAHTLKRALEWVIETRDEI